MSPRNDYEARTAALLTAQRELVDAGVLRPLDLKDPVALARWQAMDLCAMVEGAFGTRVDPLTISDEERQRWLTRLGEEYGVPRFRDPYRSPYWLLHEGEAVGTLTVGNTRSGPNTVPLGALYLLPTHRRVGVSDRALRALYEAVQRHGAGGLLLDTYWVWQDSVRYYLRRGFWVYHWKDNLALLWHKSLPPYRVEIAGDEARFLVQLDGAWQPLYRATRHAERLEVHAEPLAKTEEHMYWVGVHGEATLALALAVAGWPLVRSAEDWEESRYSDTGAPEALAYRIEWYEALANNYGWQVTTPRIPGIQYRSLAELRGPDEE